jgi:hypothetical protein
VFQAGLQVPCPLNLVHSHRIARSRRSMRRLGCSHPRLQKSQDLTRQRVSLLAPLAVRKSSSSVTILGVGAMRGAEQAITKEVLLVPECATLLWGARCFTSWWK